MATLTTSWKSYASASYTASSGAKVTFYLEARYSTQSTPNNTTTVYTRLRSTINSGYSLRGSGYSFSCTYCNTKSGTGVWTFGNEVIISSSAKTITHNTDGKKSISLSATAKNTYWNINKSMSATVDLPKIDRLATVVSATDFTDESNPTVTFDNPAGFDIKPYLNFYDNSNNLVYGLQRSTNVSSPYTWNITEAERTALRQATNQQSSYRVQVGVYTYNDSTNIGYNSLAKTFSFVDANPTQTITTAETNQKIVALLGESTANTIIKNASNLTFSVIPTALKSATVSKVELNGVPDTTSPYEFTNIVPTTNSFVVKTTDSRTLSVESTITKTMIDYEPIYILSVSFKRYAPTSSDVILNAEIKYKQATFGSTANVPTIKWKKGEDGQENTLSTSDYTVDTQNNKITISNLTLTDAIPYNNDATFYLLVQDLLTSHSDADDVRRGIPTFEAGEHDFQVNGDLYIADTNRQNPINVKDKLNWLSTQNILWADVAYMNENQSVDLTDTPVSAQPNGIILVWSAYENGAAKNWDWVTYYIPKKIVEIMPNQGYDISMHNASFGHIGGKYVYVTDTSITGNASNGSHGTSNGVTYDNRYWVLRYVIGV